MTSYRTTFQDGQLMSVLDGGQGEQIQNQEFSYGFNQRFCESQNSADLTKWDIANCIFSASQTSKEPLDLYIDERAIHTSKENRQNRNQLLMLNLGRPEQLTELVHSPRENQPNRNVKVELICRLRGTALPV